MFKFAGGVLKEILIGFLIVIFLALFLHDKIPEPAAQYKSTKTGKSVSTKDIALDSEIGVWGYSWETLIDPIEKNLEEDFGSHCVNRYRNATVPLLNELKRHVNAGRLVDGGEILTVRGMPIGEKTAISSKIYFWYDITYAHREKDRARLYAVEHYFGENNEEVYEYLKGIFTEKNGEGHIYSSDNIIEGISWTNPPKYEDLVNSQLGSYVMLKKVPVTGTDNYKVYLAYVYKYVGEKISQHIEVSGK